jgi:hypothetical protein
MLTLADMDHEKWLEQHDRMIADLDQKAVEARATHDSDMAEIREAQKRLVQDVGQILRRAIRDGIREARNERARRRAAIAEIDDKITKLASAQLLAEEETRRLRETVDRFIESTRRGGNGNHPATD